ncbi:MAG: nucleotidyltransferase family protein [Bacteroidales bacterium]|nr:nucleotidyltransferase family protein [Bacteroidales bacterium]
MRTVEELLFITLRAGLGAELSPGVEACADDALWEQVINLARKQGTLAICQDGLVRLMNEGVDTGIGKQLRRSWFSRSVSYERQYEKYTKVLSSLAGLYDKEGFKMMTMKGYGMSLLYPTPQHRPCGDIDIWLFGRQKKADLMLRKKYSVGIDDSHHIHSVFKANGITIENHYDFFNPYSYASNRRVNELLTELATVDQCGTLDLDGRTVYIPSADFNALYLVRHAAQHFAAIEITLRHLLDWGFFCKAHGSDVDWDRMLPLIESLNMDRFLHAIDAILVDYLGFSESCFPPIKRDYDLEARVLESIIAPEYPDDAKPSRGLFRILIWKLRRWSSNLWKQRIVYNESPLRTFLSQILSHILKPGTIKS